MARQNPQPYEANEIVWTDAIKLSSDYVKSIRPGKKKDNPSVSDVCAYQYSVGRDGVHVKYKLKWADEWLDLPPRISSEGKSWGPLYPERPSILQQGSTRTCCPREVLCLHRRCNTIETFLINNDKCEI
ncbi:hypothetical protein PoB_002802800 [Plakobranchus ocellatus]|uniref:Uncharacterized protein n=1 Tax=Plakobranchus ocellatus TaxID=259542 RepID=A0AAV4A2W1_9GAST|nr:hypothetical protein PoB_002802800 [Plakobranchus ocellatus]